MNMPEPVEKEKILLNITDAVKRQIICLTSAKKTGQYDIRIELNLSQGGIGSVFMSQQTRERII